MLRFMGVEDSWNSKLGTSLVLAVAWGSSLGGFLTPLCGAPNLLAMKFVQDIVTHREFLFTTWVTRLAPRTIGVVLASAVYIAGVFESEMAESDRPRAYFLDELRGLGPMTASERVSLLRFVCATMLAFMRGTVQPALAGADTRVRLSRAGSRGAGRAHTRRTAADLGIRAKQDDVGAFLAFAGGNALGAVLNTTGAAQFLAGPIVPYASRGPLVATLVFAGLTMVLAQIVSNVATVAVMVPICVRVFQAAGINPILYIYVIIAASHCGFTSTLFRRQLAVAAGYGINLRTMFVAGFGAACICLAVIVAISVLSIYVWPGFATA